MAVERKFIKESVNRLLIKDFVKAETLRAGFGGLDIQRTPLGTRVNILAERPGMVIGRRGATINQLTADLKSKFEIENPQIGVEEPNYNPALNAQIMATRVAESLERGWHFRRVGHSTVQRVMGAGAQGVIVEIAGKLTGQRKRREKFIDGHVKYCGETAHVLMESGHAQCKKKLGIIGCTVRIMRKDAVLPDQVQIYEPGEKARAQAQEVARAAASAAGVQHVAEAPTREGDVPPTDAPAPAKAKADAPTDTAGAKAKAAKATTADKTDAPAEGDGKRQRRSFTVE